MILKKIYNLAWFWPRYDIQRTAAFGQKRPFNDLAMRSVTFWEHYRIASVVARFSSFIH